jgi:hypothetical protein
VVAWFMTRRVGLVDEQLQNRLTCDDIPAAAGNVTKMGNSDVVDGVRPIEGTRG